MKKQFQSKAVPRGTRTIWRYLSALILFFALSIGQMWAAYDVPAFGTYTIKDAGKVNNSKRFNVVGTGVYHFRNSSGYSWDGSNGLKTQSTAGGVVFYLDAAKWIKVTINHTEAKNAHDITVKIINLTDEVYGEFDDHKSGANESNRTISNDISTTADSTFTIAISATQGDFAGTKKLAAGRYAIIATGSKSNTWFKSIEFMPELTWNFDGGSTSATAGTGYTKAGPVSVGATLSYPANGTMSKEGNTFEGWSSSATVMPASNLTITAQWTPTGGTQSAITYNNTKGATNSNPDTYYEGTGISSFAALADVEGFHFTGWNPSSIAADAAGPKTIIATWVPTYNVSFDKGAGGGTAPEGFQKWEGAQFNLPGQGDMTAPEGKAFGGWKVGVSDKYAAGDTYTMGTTSVQFIAQWDVLVEQVIYSWEGAEGGATEVGGTVAGSADGLINQLSAGYYCLKIDGNNSYSGNLVTITLSGEEKVKTGDKITYWGFYNKSSSANARPKMRDANSPNAQIFDDPNNLPNLNGGGDPAERTFTVPAGINTNAVQLTRSLTGSNTWISKLQIVREKAVPEEDLRTVTFNTNGGSSIAAVKVEKGTAVAKPADPTKEHCRFAGWQLSGSDYNFSSAVNSNITLDAVWTQLYTVTFAAGEGSGNAPAAVADKAQGETFPVPANTFTAPASKEFDKWNDGSADYAPGVTYTVGNANVTLTAVWKAMVSKYTVIFKDGETELGTKLFDVSTNPSDAEIDKTKPLYTFAAWQKGGEDIALNDAFWATVAKDATVTLTARWTKVYASSYDMEAYAASEGASKAGIEAALTAANYAYTNINGIDNGHSHNYTYDGLKYKTNDGDLSFNVVAGKVVEVKTGHLPSNDAVTMYINGVANATVFEGADESQETHKTNYFYSAAEALYRLEVLASKGTCAVKKITIRDPYQVLFDDNGADNPVAPQYAYPSVTLPSATKGTESFLGWFDDATAGNKIGDAGASYTPTAAAVTLYAHWEAISTDNTLSDLKVGGVTVDGFDPAVPTYYYELPYGTAVADIPVISATANSAKAKQVAIQQAVWTGEPYNCYRAQANVQAEDESWGYYDVRFSFAPKDGVSIIKVATTGGSNKTVTGAYAGDGDVNLSSSKKMDNGKYIGFILDGTTLQAGDRINVHTTQAANTGGSHIIFYGNMTDKNELYETGEIGGTGDNIFVINAAMVGATTAYVYRSNADAAHQWNGYVDYIEVLRAMDPIMTAITIDGRDGVIDEEHKTVAVQIPYEAVLSSLTVVPTIIRNAAHATTPEAVISNEGAWIEGANTYRVMDKDGDYTDYTITLNRDVLKHTVSFNTHGGSAVDAQLVVNGENPVAPADPIKEDYIFQGWAETEDGAIVDVTSFAITAAKEFHAVWASDGAIKLLSGSTVNHTNFITGVTADETVEFMGNTVNYAKFAGTVSNVNGVKDLTRVIAYNATTNKTKIKISAHNNSTSARSILVKGLVEGADAAVDLATIDLGNKEDKVSDWIEFNNAANRTIYIFVGSSAGDVYFTQVKVIESGETTLKRAGEAGYSLNFNKGRFFGVKDLTAHFEGLNVEVKSSDCQPLNTSVVKLASSSMSFDVAAPVTLTVTTNNSNTYYVTKGAAGTDNETAKTGASDFDLTAGTWYITGGSSNVEIKSIAFAAPKCAEPVIDDEPASNTNFGQGNLTASVAAHATDGADLAYQWYDASDDSEVSGATEATLTTTTEGTYYVIITASKAGYENRSIQSANATLGYRDITIATLSALSYGGTAIALEADKYEYRVDLPENTIVVPALAATATMNGYANVAISDAAAFDNYEAVSTVLVTAENGTTTQTYTVHFYVDHIYTELVDVTGDMFWDFSKANDGTAASSSLCNEAIFANVDGINNNDDFESDNLMVSANKFASGKLQASLIKFHTTVDGIITVVFSNTGSKSTERYLVVNGHKTSKGSKNTTAVTFVGAVLAGDVELTVVDGDGTMLNFTSVDFKAKATPDHHRENLNSLHLGTLCWTNNAVMALDNATLYELAGKDANNYLVFDEVMDNIIEAGKPYIFVPEDGKTEIKVFNTDDAEPKTEAQLQPVNHMYGTLEGKTLTQGPDDEMYYFSGRNIWRVADFNVAITIPAYRCYVDYPAVLAEEEPAPAPAPGRRRITMGTNGTNVATGVESIQTTEISIQKVLIDGKIYILRGEKMYDATGRLVK